MITLWYKGEGEPIQVFPDVVELMKSKGWKTEPNKKTKTEEIKNGKSLGV